MWINNRRGVTINLEKVEAIHQLAVPTSEGDTAYLILADTGCGDVYLLGMTREEEVAYGYRKAYAQRAKEEGVAVGCTTDEKIPGVSVLTDLTGRVTEVWADGKRYAFSTSSPSGVSTTRPTSSSAP